MMCNSVILPYTMQWDRSWVHLAKQNDKYIEGCQGFVELAFGHSAINGKINCPCKNCKNNKRLDKDNVLFHLLTKGWHQDYRDLERWFLHNEPRQQPPPDINDSGDQSLGDGVDDYGGVDYHGLLSSLLNNPVGEGSSDPIGNDPTDVPPTETEDFHKKVQELNTPLYPGCKNYSRLSFIIELYLIKSRGKMSDVTFGEMVHLLKNAFPDINIPDSFYETKKLIRALGCDYKKIDACLNDCMLFWKQDENLDSCKVCNEPRWKPSRDSSLGKRIKKVPKKVLRHFPLIPRLQKLYALENTAKNMRWHAEERRDDGILRHPADSDAWKEFDKKHVEYSLEPRNVRLGLATDGFNPFGNMNINYSTWPVILMVYNLPPGLCMQPSYMMMPLLIEGPTGLKHNIDVYLQH